jgi:predicted small secreted protein
MKKALLVLALALSGCAGVMRSVGQDMFPGHHAEVIEPGDWQSPVTHVAPPASVEPSGP